LRRPAFLAKLGNEFLNLRRFVAIDGLFPLPSALAVFGNGTEARVAIPYSKLKKFPARRVVSIYAAAAKLSTRVGDVPPSRREFATLASVPLPKTAKAEGKEKESINRYEPAQIQKLVAELREKAGRRKANPRDIEKIARELIVALEPQVTLALAGPVYAYFLRSTDLVVSEDPLTAAQASLSGFLVRKHAMPSYFPNHALIKQSEGAGSYFLEALLNLVWPPVQPLRWAGKTEGTPAVRPSPQKSRPFAEPSGRAWTNLINASSFCASKLHANGLLSRRVVPLSFAR